ncbi:MAG: indoleacetamide hydrolase [Pseudomonadota bacterium]
METIAVLQQRMADGELTSVDLVKQTLEAIDHQQHLNAFIVVNQIPAIERAEQLDELRSSGNVLGPLHGLPIVVKDNVHVAGLPNTAGTSALRGFVPSRDASVVERLKAAGAIIIGKSNMHELAFGITSDNRVFGAVRNAHNDTYFSGGSSGGTATAIAAGIVPAGLGTDTGGSSRIPAALNGIVGFRPTTGRYPSDGLTRISHTRDTVGPMGLSVADISLLDEILSGCSGPPLKNISLEGLRLGIPRTHFYDNLEPAVEEKMEWLLARLQDAGVSLIEADITNVGDLTSKTGLPLVVYESKELLTRYLKENRLDNSLEGLLETIASPDVKAIMAMVVNNEVSRTAYMEALEVHRVQLQSSYSTYFARHKADAVMFPTTALTARPIKGSTDTVALNGEEVPTFATFIRNTDPGSNAGIPGLTLPLAFSPAGMPIGVEIDGRKGADAHLLRVGATIEKLIRECTHGLQ